MPLAMFASGCLDSGAAPRGSDTNLALTGAPLRLDGIGMACYDAIVTNGLGQTVWARGVPATPWPTDTGTLCSDRFGNAGGGDIAYVGPCDATEPNHNVTVFIDSLWSSDPVSVPLTDWVNPCPYAATGTSGCTLAFTCVENTDVSVIFNLVVMREANQGFFDVAVNFDDVFCSAKLDCSYDAMGQNAINLLFHNGERAQTAVAALACTAGPNNNDETLLHMSHVRFRCGPAKVGLQVNVCYGGTTRTDERIYGMGASLGSGAMNLTGVVWDFDAAANGGNGSYDPSPFDPVLAGVPISASGNYTSAWNELALPPALTAAGENVALCFLAKLGNNHPVGMPYPIEYVDPAICTQNITSTEWSYAPLSLPAGWLYGSLIMSDGNVSRPDFIVHPMPLTFDAEELQQAAVFRYSSNAPAGIGDEDYAQAAEIPFPSGQRCALAEQFNRTVVGFCDTGTAWQPHIWHVRDPGDPGLQVLIDNPGRCSITSGTFCAVDGDCPGGETCDNPLPSLIGHTDANLTQYRSKNESVHARRTMATIQTLGGQTVPIITAPYWRSGSPANSMTTVEYRRNAASGAWAATAPVLAAAGNFTSTDAQFDVVRGENGAMAGGFVAVHEGANQWNTQAVFKYSGSAWTVYTAGVSIAGEGTFQNVGVQQILPNNLVLGTYSTCTGPCSDNFLNLFVAVLPGDSLSPMAGVRLPVPAGFDAQPLDGAGIQVSVIQRRSGGHYGVMARVFLHRPAPSGPSFNDVRPDAVLRWDIQSNYPSAPSVIGGYVLDPTDADVHDPPTEPGGILSSDPSLELTQSFVELGRDSRWDGERHDCQSTAFTQANILGTVGSEHLRAYAFDITATLGNVTANPDHGWELLWPASFTATANDVFEQILDLELPKGNVWSPEHATDPLWQYALYYGNENLSCGGVSCNKRYFNVALGFDPTEMNCWVHFDATASQNGIDWGTVNGTVPTTPPNSSYPIIKYAVPLTGMEGLECKQNPLNGNNSLVNMQYTGFNQQQPFCFTYDGVGLPHDYCSAFSNETLADVYSSDPFFWQDMGGGGGGGGGGGPAHWEFRYAGTCSSGVSGNYDFDPYPDPGACNPGKTAVCTVNGFCDYHVGAISDCTMDMQLNTDVYECVQ